ncbi:hypothetical protein CHUAL_000466 [Chamberlinius hualienensis]
MDNNELKRIRVGSRKSQLALIQTNIVVDSLKKRFKDLEFEIVTLDTVGDNVLDKALSKIGEKSLFTKELEVALAEREVDLVVHSLKDMPTTLPEGMTIGAILEREDPSDAVVLHPKFSSRSLSTLPEGSVLGTSSLRRIAQLRKRYPRLEFENVRGNLNTRLRKLDEGDHYAALILATAGLARMGWSDRINQKLPDDICLHAVGQGALAIEIRSQDAKIQKLVDFLNHKETLLRCVAERAFMRKLEGGCSVPVAVSSSLQNEMLTLKGGVFSLDGSRNIVGTRTVSISEKHGEKPNNSVNESCGVETNCASLLELNNSYETGVLLADDLLVKGAKDILSEIRQQSLNV